MTNSTAGEHYEEKFEFPLWKMIKQRAEEKGISYGDAAGEVLPEWDKTIRYRDSAYSKSEVEKRHKEIADIAEREKNQRMSRGG